MINEHVPRRDESELTCLLNLGLSGDAQANARAFDIVYGALRDSARRQLRRSGPSTFSPTALVSEVFLKLNDGATRSVNDRAHFYSLAARAMRQVLLDHQRNRSAMKRGGDVKHVEIDLDLDAAFGDNGDGLDMMALDQALDALRKIDPRATQVVEWHFFSGLNFLEIAELLNISDKTARRDWESARAFLLMQLGSR